MGNSNENEKTLEYMTTKTKIARRGILLASISAFFAVFAPSLSIILLGHNGFLVFALSFGFSMGVYYGMEIYSKADKISRKKLEKKNDMLKLKQVANNEKYVSEKRNLLIENSKSISPLKQSEPLSSDVKVRKRKKDS